MINLFPWDMWLMHTIIGAITGLTLFYVAIYVFTRVKNKK